MINHFTLKGVCPVGENGVMAQFRKFSADLLKMCGDLKIGIEVSVYATEEDDEEDENT